MNAMMRKSTTILTCFKSNFNNFFSSSTRLKPNFTNQHPCRFNSTTARNPIHDQAIDFPGGNVKFIPQMRILSESQQHRVPCYRVLDDNGEPLFGTDFVQVCTYFTTFTFIHL